MSVPLPSIEDLEARPLLPEQLPLLQALLQRCDDYHQLVYGLPARPDEADQLVRGRPSEVTEAQKHLWGLFRADGTLGGAMDALSDFPGPGEWYLGLLLLEPELRGGGRGRALAQAFELHVRRSGGHLLRLAVAEQNAKALRFWTREGFVQEARVGPRLLGARESYLLRLKKLLVAQAY
ncbi:GNAT family N-acetyltransferase [Aggregicoccus sp. 17bor-14]|uniref:GNAT family N-acetyltransferase n=1 Tax=Myxococcaceae TaxID=31 RepID=UPI00129C15FA|nr:MULTISPECIES: GNAT family N-acetyltransferase [Myxococcaceae]MBF5045205.1 GNAT family N-acetyltransferase [Simulacricoccus sp. 17bor-14]MRI90946.1 GNAT family N-acetyltransferase [Aggregicoccus sp. 17bor-14]